MTAALLSFRALSCGWIQTRWQFLWFNTCIDAGEVELILCKVFNPVEVGQAEVGIAEVGPVEVRPDEVGAAEVGLAEVGSAEDGPDEVGLAEVGLAEVGLEEDGVAEIGVDEVGAAKVGVEEVGPGYFDTYEVRFRYRYSKEGMFISVQKLQGPNLEPIAGAGVGRQAPHANQPVFGSRITFFCSGLAFFHACSMFFSSNAPILLALLEVDAEDDDRDNYRDHLENFQELKPARFGDAIRPLPQHAACRWRYLIFAHALNLHDCTVHLAALVNYCHSAVVDWTPVRMAIKA